MSELFDKEVNAQKEKSSGVHASPRKKCAMKMKQRNKETKKQEKKRRARKNVIDGRRHYIGRLRKTGEDD